MHIIKSAQTTRASLMKSPQLCHRVNCKLQEAGLYTCKRIVYLFELVPFKESVDLTDRRGVNWFLWTDSLLKFNSLNLIIRSQLTDWSGGLLSNYLLLNDFWRLKTWHLLTHVDHLPYSYASFLRLIFCNSAWPTGLTSTFFRRTQKKSNGFDKWRQNLNIGLNFSFKTSCLQSSQLTALIAQTT